MSREDCLFCKIIQKKIPADIVFENDSIIAFKDIHPAAPVHILIVPKKHIGTIDDLEREDSPVVNDIIFSAQKIARELQIAGKGYRLIFNVKSDGGQIVNHIHLHLIGGKKLS